MSGTGRRIFICLALLMVSGSTSAEDKPNASQSAAVLEVSPSSVELTPGGRPTEALLILRNPSTAAFVDVNITTFSDGEVDVNTEPHGAQSIIPKGELAWRLTVSSKSGAPVNGTIFLRVDYAQNIGGQRIPKVAHTKLSFTGRDISELADVKIATTLASLDEHHPGKVYLVITNKSNQAIRLSNFTPEGPAFISLSKSWFEQNEAVEFLPHQTRSIPIDVKVIERVQPGSHLLVFTLNFEWKQNGATQERSAVVTQPVEVGVLGESAVLKLLGVPSFLLVPGFLAVATWGLLWNWRVLRSPKDTAGFPFSLDKPVVNLQFWVVAITVSILIVMGYSLLNPGILRSYNLEDLVTLWLTSVFGVGVAGYLAIIGWREWRRRRRTPSIGDSALEVLEKLGRQKLSTFRETVSVSVKPGEAPRRAYLLQELSDKRATSWVGPAILVTWEADLSDENKRLKQKVTEQRRPTGEPGLAARLLKQAGAAVTTQWKTPAETSIEIEGIHEVTTSELDYSEADSILVDADSIL